MAKPLVTSRFKNLLQEEPYFQADEEALKNYLVPPAPGAAAGPLPEEAQQDVAQAALDGMPSNEVADKQFSTPVLNERAEVADNTPKPLTLAQFGQGLNDVDYQQALEQQQKQVQNINIMRALDQIGQGGVVAAGGTPNKDNSLFDNLEQSAKLKGEAIEKRRKGKQQELEFGKDNITVDNMLQDETALRDSNSIISQVYRQAAKKLGLEVPETATGRSLEKVLPVLKETVKRELENKFQQGGIDEQGNKLVFDPQSGQYRTTNVRAAENFSQTKNPKTGAVEIYGKRTGETKRVVGGGEELEEGQQYSREQLNPKQTEGVDKTREAILQDKTIQGVREASAELDKTKKLVQANVPGSAGAVRRSLLKMFESGGRFTDQDVQQFGGSQAVLSKLERSAQEALTGKPFTAEDQKYFQQLIKVIDRENQGAAQAAGNYYVDGLVKRGIPKDYAQKAVMDEVIPKVPLSERVKLPKAFKPDSILKIKGETFKVNPDGKTATKVK